MKDGAKGKGKGGFGLGGESFVRKVRYGRPRLKM